MAFVDVTTKNEITTVTLNRPELHNAFNDEMITELTAIFAGFKNERLIVLTGAGKSFCAGADLNWMKSMVNYSKEENYQDSKALAEMFDTINQCSVPVIGKINGHALGGGVGLLSVCDYVLCADAAKLGFTEVRLGIIPAVISPYVYQKIGESHARAWFLSGERFTAEQGQRMNLVHEVVPLDELDQRLDQLSVSFLKAGPRASKEAKKLIFGIQTAEDVMDYTCGRISELRVSSEGQDGMNALLEKRTASWLKK